MRGHFECTEAGASKFWEIEREGTVVTTWWGKIGTAGQTKSKQFASADAAQAEHDKLVREKTGKGYVESGSTAAAPASASKKSATPSEPPEDAAPPVAPAGETSYRAFTQEIDLSKVKVKTGEDKYGPGQWPRILWAMARAGLLPKSDAIAALPTLARKVAIAEPAAILSLLQSLPPKPKLEETLQVLTGYTLAMDALLTHLAHRGTELLRANEASLPAYLSRALPLVRARLGHGSALDPALLDEFARGYTSGFADGPVVALKDGVLVSAQETDYASIRALAAHLGDPAAWEAKVRAAGVGEDGTLPSGHRTGLFVPCFRDASIAELAKATASSWFHSDHFRWMLAGRTDGVAALVELLALQPDDDKRKNLVAARIGKACRAEGKPLPKEAAAALTLDLPYQEEEAYVETIRMLDEAAVRARTKKLVAAKDDESLHRAAVGLAAFHDDELYRKLLAHAKLGSQHARALALAGEAGLAGLVAACERAKDDHYKSQVFGEAYTRAAANAHRRTGLLTDEAFDQYIGGERSATEELLAAWPKARAQRWLEARATSSKWFDTMLVLSHVAAATDALLDRALVELMKKDGDSILAHRDQLAAGGPTLDRALLRALSQKKNDKKLMRLLDWANLSHEAYAGAQQIVFGGEAPFAALPNEERVFTDETTAILIAGRPVQGKMDRAGLLALCARLDALATQRKAHVALGVGADLDNTQDGDHLHAVMGIEIVSTDTWSAKELDARTLTESLAAARSLPWKDLVLPEGWAFSDEEAAVYCVAAGPLSVAKLATGKLLEDDEESDDDNLVRAAPMGQEGSGPAVRGKLLASASYDAEPVVRLETDQLGKGKKAYFLLASYDF